MPHESSFEVAPPGDRRTSAIPTAFALADRGTVAVTEAEEEIKILRQGR